MEPSFYLCKCGHRYMIMQPKWNRELRTEPVCKRCGAKDPRIDQQAEDAYMGRVYFPIAQVVVDRVNARLDKIAGEVRVPPGMYDDIGPVEGLPVFNRLGKELQQAMEEGVNYVETTMKEHEQCDREIAFLRNECRLANRKLREMGSVKPKVETPKNFFPVSIRQQITVKKGDKFSLFSVDFESDYRPKEVVLSFEDAMRLRFLGGDSQGLEWVLQSLRIQGDYAGEGGRLRMRTVEFPLESELVKKGNQLRVRFEAISDFTGPFLVTIMGFKADPLTTELSQP